MTGSVDAAERRRLPIPGVLAAPISFSGRLVQYAGRILRPWPGKETAEVHDYVDADVPILASSLSKRARGYTSLGFPDPRGLTPSGLGSF